MKTEKEIIESIKQKIGKSKKTPKKGWQRGGTFPFFNIEGLYAEITGILGVDKISPEMLESIRDAVDKYQISCKIDLEAPNPSQIKASFLWLANGCQKGEEEFQYRFGNLDAIARDRLAMVDYPKNLDVLNAKRIESYRALMLIDKACDFFIKSRCKKRKATAGPRRQLLFELCGIYHQITNQKPGVTFDPYEEEYSGIFYNFALYVLAAADKTALSPESAGVRIAEICAEYNKLYNN